MSARDELLPGTLDMLVLRVLELGANHGWGITDRLEQRSESVLRVGQGSLYPSVYRLERQGFISSQWRVTENNRRARYYALTAAGRRQLASERAVWERQSRAVNLVLRLSEA